jgi:hypothetical protein
MTSEEFILKYNRWKDPLIKEYGEYLYFLASDVVIYEIEAKVENLGYKTVRKKIHTNTFSDILFDGKVIGTIENVGLPTIMVNRGFRTEHARKFSKLDGVIEPIQGVHRILEWHEVEGKLHKLAGGETIINFMPYEISLEYMRKFSVNMKLIDKVEDFKQGI